MARWLYAHRTVVGDPERLARRLRTSIRPLLQRAAGAVGDEVAVDGSFPIRLHPNVGAVGGVKTVRVTTGVATTVDRVEQRLHLPVRWHAEPARHLFPTFDGALELSALSGGSADLVLIGTYRPPLGLLGAVADTLALHEVAHATADHLVALLAHSLEEAADAAPSEGDGAPSPAAALRVGDLMTPDPLVLDVDLPVRTAALLLTHYDVSGAPVADSQGELVGVLSEADLLEKEAAPCYGWSRSVDEARRRRQALTVGEACSRPARVTVPEATLREATRVMLDARVARLVVLDESRIAGILTRSDVLKALLRTDAALQQAVDAALRELDEPGVHGVVQWGGVELSGQTRYRSRIDAIVQRIGQIDGVVSVEHDLGHREDDVVVYPPVSL